MIKTMNPAESAAATRADELAAEPGGATPPRWTWSDTLALALLVACAAVLYLWRLDQPGKYTYDEVYHAYTAAQLAAGNADAYRWDIKVPESARSLGVAYEWVHPALAKLPMQVGIRLFGDGPFGWRVASAIFGALGIGALYLLGRALLGRALGLLAAVLLLLDGLWFVQSRTAMNDVFLVVFLLLAYLAAYQRLGGAPAERGRWLWLTGGALGLAIATKWSAVYSYGLLALLTLGREVWLLRAAGWPAPWRPLARWSAALVLLPAAVYVAGYAQFFLMGHTPADWRELQWQMWRYHSGLRACHEWASPAWSWPFLLRPVWYSVQRFPDGGVAHVFALGNPVIWWAFLSAVAVAGLGWARGRGRDLGLALILVGFLGQWLPWLLSPRIAYLYHMLPAVPFGCLAVAYALGLGRHRRVVIGGFLALALAAFAFFYPHYAALPVSADFARLHDWAPTWAPGSRWAFACPPAAD